MLRLGYGVLQLQQDAGYFLPKNNAFGSKCQLLLTAVKQLYGNLFFQALDGNGDGRLGHVQVFGGARDIAKFADHLEIFELSYVHRLPPGLLIFSIITW